MIDEVLSNTDKADGMLVDMDNGQHVDMKDQPPSQQEERTQQVPKEEPEPFRTRASNLPKIRVQPVKKLLASDMAASLDRFC